MMGYESYESYGFDIMLLVFIIRLLRGYHQLSREVFPDEVTCESKCLPHSPIAPCLEQHHSNWAAREGVGQWYHQ